MATKVSEDKNTNEPKVGHNTVILSERQLCLRDAAHLRKQCERMNAPSDSMGDRFACPVWREMVRLQKISAEM
jgi:hypothetical protein